MKICYFPNNYPITLIFDFILIKIKRVTVFLFL
jgi:hypothetical protein